MLTVMAFGTFDLLHPGHCFYLKQAKALGSKLVVVVACDKNVLGVKGKRPLNSEAKRLKQVSGLEFVDRAVLGDSELKSWNVIKSFNPNVIALGYDQWPSIPSLKKELGKLGLNPKIVRIGALEPGKNSSRKLRNK